MTDPTIELHFHALHGLDDGPSTIEESVDLLCQARIDGTVSVVATPHVRGDFVTDVRDLGDRVAELRAAARRNGVDVRVEVGAELAAGSLAQVNAGSITGLHGEGARAAVMGLIREGLASALSSDAHGPTRPPLLAAAGACLLEAGLGRDVRDALILRGPRRLLVRGIRAPLIAA